MSNFKITIYLVDLDTIVLTTDYQKEYDLKTDVINIGRNGIMNKKENKHIYYPPHKIVKIEVEPESQI